MTDQGIPWSEWYFVKINSTTQGLAAERQEAGGRRQKALPPWFRQEEAEDGKNGKVSGTRRRVVTR